MAGFADFIRPMFGSQSTPQQQPPSNPVMGGLGGFLHTLGGGLSGIEHAIGGGLQGVENTAQNVGHAVNNFSIPDSAFDPIRSLVMHKSDLQNYQYLRDYAIASQRAQHSPSAIIQAYGSYNPNSNLPLPNQGQ